MHEMKKEKQEVIKEKDALETRVKKEREMSEKEMGVMAKKLDAQKEEVVK